MIIISARSWWLGCGKCALRCNIMDGEGRGFTKDDLVNLFCICTMIENGMGRQNLGSGIY